MRISPRRKKTGLSLPEIIIAFGIFGIGIAGLLLTSQTVFEGLRSTTKGDMEAVYANMLVARINPYDPAVELDYDETTKTELPLPNGETPCAPTGADPDKPCVKVFYTSTVDSDAETPDIKDIHIYLFQKASSTEPFRQFKREIAPYFVGFDLGVASGYTKDSLGHVWAPLGTTGSYDSTPDSRRNGLTETVSNVTGACGLTGNNLAFNTSHQPAGASTQLGYKFLATLDRTYTLRLGGIELNGGITAGQRRMKIMVNGIQVGTLDPVVDGGGTCKPVLKTFNVKPASPDGNGVASILVELQQDSGAVLPPQLAAIALERTEL